MIEVTATPIILPSHAIRVFLNGAHDKDGKPSDIDTVALFERISEELCEVTLAKGFLSNEVNINLGLKAIALGYKMLRFRRTMGGLATRWAKQVSSSDGMDYYHVDLMAALHSLSSRA